MKFHELLKRWHNGGDFTKSVVSNDHIQLNYDFLRMRMPYIQDCDEFKFADVYATSQSFVKTDYGEDLLAKTRILPSDFHAYGEFHILRIDLFLVDIDEPPLAFKVRMRYCGHMKSLSEESMYV